MSVIRVATPKQVIGSELWDELGVARQALLGWSAHYARVVINSWELGSTTRERLEPLIDPREEWIFIGDPHNGKILAYDEPSAEGVANPAAGVAYPEIASRLWTWWITHAWRTTELAVSASEAVEKWSMASCSVLVRALLEEVASLAHEARQIQDAWAKAKQLKEGPARPGTVRQHMNPPLLHAFRGSRMPASPESLRATNVLTLIGQLKRSTGRAEIETWYEWLTEAAHPAFAAPLVHASNLMAHPSRAIFRATYSLRPMVVDPGDGSVVVNEQMRMTATCLLECIAIFMKLGPQVESSIRDFELTTGARSLTTSQYVVGLEIPPDVALLSESTAHVWGGSVSPITLKLN